MRFSKFLFTTWKGVKFVAKLVGHFVERRRYHTRPIAITAQTIQAPVIAAVKVLPVAELPELEPEPPAIPDMVTSFSPTSQQQESDRGQLVEALLLELQPELQSGPEPPVVPNVVTSSSPTRRRRQSDRGKVVEELLEQASKQGAVTYEDFISFVKEQTGEGCSRRTVAIWKKSRRLIDVTT